MDARILVILVVAVLAGAWFWWRAGSGGPEAHLRRICFGDQGQVNRLIDGEMERAGGALSREEAARRAVERHRRDNR